MKAKFLLFGCALLLAAPGAGGRAGSGCAERILSLQHHRCVRPCRKAVALRRNEAIRRLLQHHDGHAHVRFRDRNGDGGGPDAERSDHRSPIRPRGAISQNPLNGTSAYTNTGKELTIFGETYKIAYGVISSGVVKNFVFVGTSTTSGLTKANCVARGVADLIN
jgi:hypothetical protein